MEEPNVFWLLPVIIPYMVVSFLYAYAPLKTFRYEGNLNFTQSLSAVDSPFMPRDQIRCEQKIQGLRQARYKNSGEYQCKNLNGNGNHDLQCVETSLYVGLLIFSVGVLGDGACVDFSSGDVWCYSYESTGFEVSVGVDLGASYSMTVSCPHTTDEISGGTAANCAPGLEILGLSFFPQYCGLDVDGYSLSFGTGDILSAKVFSYDYSSTTVTAKGKIELGDEGVVGHGILRYPFSFEWVCFGLYVAIGAAVVLFGCAGIFGGG